MATVEGSTVEGSTVALEVDYVSPLPPVRSGISDYSADLLPHLAQRCDLRVLRLKDQPVSAEIEELFSPIPAEAALAQVDMAGSKGRLPFYQMGNNRYHADVGKLARRFPGVLTLHDLFLHHLLSEETLGRGVFEPYRERLEQDHGDLGRWIADPRRWGGYSDASLFSLAANRGLLFSQRGILVHSRWAAGVLAEEAPELAVRVVPMGVPLPEVAQREQGLTFRRRYGLPEDGAVLGSFGFQTPIKRTDRAVRALAEPGLENVHLLIVGQVSEHSDLEGTARRAGVADRIHITGFVSFEDFQAAIAATDLCLNLRYPTAGETSASLLRVLAGGRPAVVSEYAQFAELPDDIALKVPLGDDEAGVLAARLRELLAAPEALATMGRQARRYVAREHAPGRAADAMVAACRELAGLEPPRAPKVMNPLPSTLTWSRFSGELTVEGGSSNWAPGERRDLRLRLSNGGGCRWLAAREGAGGVAVEAQLSIERGGEPVNVLAGEPWIPLPQDLAPGESCVLTASIRRPPQAARLRFEPHVVGGAGFAAQGGPWWEKRFEGFEEEGS